MSNRILVTRSSMPPFEEYCEEIRPLWESHWLTNMGEEHRKLEEALKERLRTPNVCLFTNGHNALECILEALGLHGEVVTTPFSFASTTHAIARKGLTPVFADVRESDCTLDPERIEEAITPRTCAIVPVHVYGNLCDVDAIQDIADRHGLRVVYDAAHACGVKGVKDVVARGPEGLGVEDHRQVGVVGPHTRGGAEHPHARDGLEAVPVALGHGAALGDLLV